MVARLLTTLLWRFLGNADQLSLELVHRADFHRQLLLLFLYLGLDQNWILSYVIVIEEAVDPHEETTGSSAGVLDLLYGERVVLGALENFGEKSLCDAIKVVVVEVFDELARIGEEFLCFWPLLFAPKSEQDQIHDMLDALWRAAEMLELGEVVFGDAIEL